MPFWFDLAINIIDCELHKTLLFEKWHFGAIFKTTRLSQTKLTSLFAMWSINVNQTKLNLYARQLSPFSLKTLFYIVIDKKLDPKDNFADWKTRINAGICLIDDGRLQNNTPWILFVLVALFWGFL